MIADPKTVDYSFILRRYDVESENISTPESVASKMLPKNPFLSEIAASVMFLRLKDVGPSVMRGLQMGISPLEVMNDGLVVGMEIVSHLYSERIYFLPEVMMAAKALEIGMSLAEKQLPGGRISKGSIVMHSAEGDPHDIGKNIAAVMLKSAGYTVIDLGKDVPVDVVVDIVLEKKPIMVTGTALMTTTMSAFPEAAKKLSEAGMDIPYMASGGAVNKEYAESFDCGIYSMKAPHTPPIAERILQGADWRTIREEWDEITKGV